MTGKSKDLYQCLVEDTKSVSVDSTAIKKDTHRELIIEVKPGKSAYAFLKLTDEQFTWYNVPLGRVSTRSVDAQSKGDSTLIPVIPLCYTTPDCDPKKAQGPRKGHIYIYRGDYLWRELEVIEHGHVRDVNLREYQGKDIRKSTVDSDKHILLPYEIGGKKEKIWMCFSEIQWSWSRINSMGGMNPKDFRIIDSAPPLFASDLNISKSVAQKNRSHRMQEIDLSGFKNGTPISVPVENKARVENTDNLTAKTYHKALHAKSKIAAVYLYDPIGVAINNMADYYLHQIELMGEVQAAQEHAHFKSAVMAYRSFFDADLKETYQRAIQGKWTTHYLTEYKNNSDSDKVFRNCADAVDKNFIEEDILRVSRRKEVRKKMRSAKTTHVEFMDAKYKGKSLFDSNSDFVHIIPAILDYAELPVADYLQLWSLTHNLIHFMNTDPSQFDSAMDLDNTVKSEKPGKDSDIGTLYLNSLLQPDDEFKKSLHAALFPSNEQIDIYKEEFKYAGKPTEPGNGNGTYRPAAFAYANNHFKKPHRELRKDLKDSFEFPNQVIASFIYTFTTQWKLAMEGKISTSVTDVFVRLAKGTNIPEIVGATFIDKNSPLGDRVVLSGEITILDKIKRSEKRKLAKDSANGKIKNGIKVLNPIDKSTLLTADFKDLPNFKGVPQNIELKDWIATFKSKDSSGLYRARGKFVILPKDNPYAIKYHIPEADVPNHVANKVAWMRIGDKTLPPLLGVLEVWNLVSVVSEITQKGFSGKRFSQSLISVIGIAYAMVDITARLASEGAAIKLIDTVTFNKPAVGKKTLGQKFMQVERKLLRSNTTFFKAGGAGLAGLGAFLASWDMVDSLIADDDDAAAMYGVQMVSSLGLALSTLAQGGITALAAFGPYGWAFLGVALLAGYLAYIFTDTQLEKWAKHGPFAKTVMDRMSGEYGKESDPKSQGMTSEARAYWALLSLLMTPAVKIKKDMSQHSLHYGVSYSDIVVEVHMPGFKPGQSTADIRATIQQGKSEQVLIKPYEIEPIYLDDNNPTSQIGFRYRYATPFLSSTYDKVYGKENIKVLSGDLVFRARARHITDESIIIPTLPSDKNTADHPVTINEEVIGWVYDEKELTRPRVYEPELYAL